MMKARTALLITTAAALFVGAFENTAHAKQAIWKKMQYWTVLGDPAIPYCDAFSTFKDGTVIHFGVSTSGWTMILQGVQSQVGSKYSVGMATQKTAGVMYGEGAGDNTVVFHQLELETIVNMALTPKLAIVGLGNFNMSGSKEAVLETAKCYKAMQGRDA